MVWIIKFVGCCEYAVNLTKLTYKDVLKLKRLSKFKLLLELVCFHFSTYSSFSCRSSMAVMKSVMTSTDWPIT